MGGLAQSGRRRGGWLPRGAATGLLAGADFRTVGDCGRHGGLRPIHKAVSGQTSHAVSGGVADVGRARRSGSPAAARAAGWAFLAAGLVLVSAAMLVPAWRELDDVRRDHSRLSAQVELEARRLATTVQVRDSVQRRDPELTRRLIAWQLNHVPAGDTAYAREVHAEGVLGWIDHRVEPMPPMAASPPTSRLEGLVTGQARLWVLGGGSILVFVGLVGFTETAPRGHRKRALSA